MAWKPGWLSRWFGRGKPSEPVAPPRNASPDPVDGLRAICDQVNQNIDRQLAALDDQSRLEVALELVQEAIQSGPGDKDASIALAYLKRAIPLLEASWQQSRSARLGDLLAIAYSHQGDLLFQDEELRDLSGAVAAYERGIEFYGEHFERDPDAGTAASLAWTHMGRGMALAALGMDDQAASSFARAVQLYDKLVEQDHRADLGSLQAKAYLNLAVAMEKTGTELSTVLAAFDEGISLVERMVRREQRADLQPLLDQARRDRDRVAGRISAAATPRVSAGYGFSPLHPILVHEPDGERLFIASLRCPHGHALRGPRRGSMSGKCPHPASHKDDFCPDGNPAEQCLVDCYDLVCVAGEYHCSLYFDMYHPHAPHQPAPEPLTFADAAKPQGLPALAASALGVEWTKGQRLLDDFVIEDELGAGGMGKVYRVRSLSTGQRFAVKKTHFRDAAGRRNFLAELQTWIDMPAHPHLVACRFFRSVGTEEAIFAEYIEGGSLADWIAQRRLTRLDPILDVAIQVAWGLHAAHERGFLHQDVKPANVLLTADGLAKVGDFGLARALARARHGSEIGAEAAQNVGMTPAYCSPEQAAGRPLTRQTDLWSWAVSVLEMFTGEVTWQTGVAAPYVLEDLLMTGPLEPDRPMLPAQVADVLRRCFAEDPAERWSSLALAADRLREVYPLLCGTPYPRINPELSAPHRGETAADASRQVGPTTDPHAWLRKAYAAAGRDPNVVESVAGVVGHSPNAQAVADLAQLEEARRIFVELVASGRTEWEADLATLYADKASLHYHIGDPTGALTHYDHAIALGERLLDKKGQETWAYTLGRLYNCKADVLGGLHDKQGQAEAYDRAMTILAPLIEQEDVPGGLPALLAQICVNRGILHRQDGDFPRAVRLYDAAIRLLEQFQQQADGTQERFFWDDLIAWAYSHKAVALTDLKRAREALPLFDAAIAIYEPLVEKGNQKFAGELAWAWMNKGVALRQTADREGLLDCCSRAIAIYQEVVQRERRPELRNNLAKALMLKSLTEWELGRLREATVLLDRVIAIRQELVDQEGRQEYLEDLAVSLNLHGAVVMDLGDHQRAIALFRQAIRIYCELVEGRGREDLAPKIGLVRLGLAKALHSQGTVDLDLGNYQQALELIEEAIRYYSMLTLGQPQGTFATEIGQLNQSKAIALEKLRNKRSGYS